eukprot:gene2579-2881_t
MDFTGSLTPLHALNISGGCGTGALLDDAAAQGLRGSAAQGHRLRHTAHVISPDMGSGVGAAAWLDRLVVFIPPWQSQKAAVLCEYHCPEVPEGPLAPVRSAVAFIPGSSALLLFTSPCLGASALIFNFSTGQPLRQLPLLQPDDVIISPISRCSSRQPSGDSPGCSDSCQTPQAAPVGVSSVALSPAGGLMAFGLSCGGRVVVTDIEGTSSSNLTVKVAAQISPLQGGSGPVDGGKQSTNSGSTGLLLALSDQLSDPGSDNASWDRVGALTFAARGSRLVAAAGLIMTVLQGP